MVSNFKNLVRHSKTNFFWRGGEGVAVLYSLKDKKKSIKWIENFYKFNAHLLKIVNYRSLLNNRSLAITAKTSQRFPTTPLNSRIRSPGCELLSHSLLLETEKLKYYREHHSFQKMFKLYLLVYL